MTPTGNLRYSAGDRQVHRNSPAWSRGSAGFVSRFALTPLRSLCAAVVFMCASACCQWCVVHGVNTNTSPNVRAYYSCHSLTRGYAHAPRLTPSHHGAHDRSPPMAAGNWWSRWCGRCPCELAGRRACSGDATQATSAQSYHESPRTLAARQFETGAGRRSAYGATRCLVPSPTLTHTHRP